MNILIHGANATLPSPPPPFKPESKFIRINVLWFISLSLSLTTVLVGTLCMQWLREYRHYDSLTHRDALLLRQMRYEGLLRWKVLTPQMESPDYHLSTTHSSAERLRSFFRGHSSTPVDYKCDRHHCSGYRNRLCTSFHAFDYHRASLSIPRRPPRRNRPSKYRTMPL